MKESRIEMSDEAFFIFCDKKSGVLQFRLAEQAHDRVAALIAIQCLQRGYRADELTVLIPANRKVVANLLAKAGKLLRNAQVEGDRYKLSSRQREVLAAITRHEANKEIAKNLNIRVRTVKFHISALLAKFGVDNRTALANRAAGMLRIHVGEIPYPTRIIHKA